MGAQAMTTSESDGAQVVAEHIQNCRPDITAALVMQDGSGDEVVAGLLAEGWIYAAEPEFIAGKRIRTLQPPEDRS